MTQQRARDSRGDRWIQHPQVTTTPVPAHKPAAQGAISRLRKDPGEYRGGFFNTKGVSIPVAVSVFPGEQYQAPRSWVERAYPKLIYYNKVDKGGHFAAWEQPQLFSEEVRAGFRSLR